jgi:hypothetical protein
MEAATDVSLRFNSQSQATHRYAAQWLLLHDEITLPRPKRHGGILTTMAGLYGHNCAMPTGCEVTARTLHVQKPIGLGMSISVSHKRTMCGHNE